MTIQKPSSRSQCSPALGSLAAIPANNYKFEDAKSTEVLFGCLCPGNILMGLYQQMMSRHMD